jgi:hypothetical protein
MMDDTHLDTGLRDLEHATKDRYLTPDSYIRAGIFTELKHRGGVLKSVIKIELAEQSVFYQEVLEEGRVMSKLAATAKDIGEFEGTPGEMG